jgi:ubiquinone/menaquinone biosynthesis C-methylase UbiE
MTEVELSIEERLLQVLQHLGIQQAHFAARGVGDWGGLAVRYPNCITSLTLICPRGMDPSTLGTLAPRLLVFAGDQGRPDAIVRQVVAQFQEATLIALRDYVSPTIYADVVADRSADIGAAMLDFLARMDQAHESRAVSLREGEGEVAGISYRICGAGLPLVLLPLGVAPSQWEPLFPRLSERYCTIILGGASLGMIGSLEARGHTAGYLGVVRHLLEEAQLQPGETVLEVGCGTGVLDRWLARHTGGANRVVGLDISPYLLREATALVRKEDLEGIIEFREGRAEALPFSDNSFDIAMSSTVIQRVDADQMLREMVRVTKPGGRVAVVGHAHDMPRWVNLALPAELKAKLEAPGWASDRGHQLGCDDASLYRRFHQIGLTQVKMFPQFAAFNEQSRLQSLQGDILPTLTPDAVQEWRTAVAQAEAAETFFIATPFHCAVGTKPLGSAQGRL